MTRLQTLVIGWLVLACLTPSTNAEDSFETLRKSFESEVRPLLTEFCLKCHSTDKSEGDLDLERFTKLDEVRREPRIWERVVEMLDNREMPPKKKPQPTDAQRSKLRGWTKTYLETEARANAGDPGPVLLRRLSNVEYDNTIRDLTQIDLRPAREFPVDGAAGEGFTNVGEALSMSPAMLDKYVASAKGIASHVVLLPDGFRFSDKATRRDWTDEIVTQIRELYLRKTAKEGATRVNLQGIISDTNAGGRIPLERYLVAAIQHRENKNKTLHQIATENGISPKYLRIVWETLEGKASSPLLDRLRTIWKKTSSDDVPALASEIRQWQTALTKFNSVAHFKKWQEPVNPILESQEIRLKLDPPGTAQDVSLFLTTKDAGDGNTDDVVEWREPRLEAPGRPPILLRDLRDGLDALNRKRATYSETAKYLSAVDELRSSPPTLKLENLAKERHLDPLMLSAWSECVGIGQAPAKIEGLFTQKMVKGGGYDFVNSWGFPETPSIVANSSDMLVKIPGTLRPHSLAVHPSPEQDVAIGWRSPATSRVHVEARVVHTHPDCGNGVSWSLEVRRAGERRRLAAGLVDLGKTAKIEPVSNLPIYQGDVISLIVGARDRNHSCDLTEVELVITEEAGLKRTWALSRDVSGDILKANPHPDSHGNPEVWLFYQEKPNETNNPNFASLPGGSLLDRWCQEPDRTKRADLAEQLQGVLSGSKLPASGSPDALLLTQLNSAGGPMFGRMNFAQLAAEQRTRIQQPQATFGLNPERFGSKRQPGVSETSMITEAPTSIEIRIPADLAKGREFVSQAVLNAPGSVQVLAGLGPASSEEGLLASSPILAHPGTPARARIEEAFRDFRRVFPAALCYPQIVPVDEVVTLVLFHRDDEELRRLILDEADTRELDRLWDELRYVSQDAIKVQEAYGQFMEYVTQDGDVRLFEPLRKPIGERAEALRRRLAETEPRHLERLIAFAAKAYRRPLTETESAGLQDLYSKLRNQKIDHDTAFRLVLARILVAPAFLYHIEEPSEGRDARPVSDWELASRLSYFLWSSQPDDELRRVAENHTLRQPEVLKSQTVRMLRDPRARSFVTEFACQWMDIRGFDLHNEKSEKVFPKFAGLREAMYEEAVRFFADLFARDGAVLEVLDSDHTFVNEALAEHYGIPGVKGAEWRRVDGIKTHGRGGILGMAALLSKQSGASRTSPILRGNWLVETLLGDKLPKPPKNVPQLPESELDTDGLTMRQITEKHRALESCSKCHDRFDPFGFALEKFDAVGKRRDADLAGRPVDTRAKLKDGTEFDDISGLRDYLLAQRRDEFVRHFCRKLLGYSLGRSVQLSDEPLLEEMQRTLASNGYRVQSAIFTVLNSPQFQNNRGRSSPLNHAANP